MKIKAYKKNRRCIANGSVESMTLHLVDGIVMEIPGTHINAVATCHDSDEYDADFGVALASAKYKYKEAQIRMNQHVQASKALRAMAAKLVHEADVQDKIANEMDGKVTSLEFAVDCVLANKYPDNEVK